MSSLLFFQEFTLSILRHRRQLRRQLRRHNHLRICSCFVISISLPHLTLKPSHLRRSTGEAAKESIDKKDDFLCFSGSILLFESSVLFFTSSFCCILISSEDRSLLEIDLLLFITLDRFYLFFASSCHLCHEVLRYLWHEISHDEHPCLLILRLTLKEIQVFLKTESITVSKRIVQ